MSTINKGPEDGPVLELSKAERTVALAQALGADVVYPVLGHPSVVDFATGNLTIDRANPIYISPETPGGTI